MLTIGITGGVATGKSTVATLFRQHGATVLSADEAAREVTAPGSPVLAQIASASAFGHEYILPDGSLDRAALGQRVFSKSEDRAALEAITHPAILQRLHEQIEAARAVLPPNSVIAVEVPLLYEAGMESWFDRVVVAACSEPVQLSRLQSRGNLSEEEARLRTGTQMPLAEKISRAHYTLWNNSTLEYLQMQFEKLWDEFMALGNEGE